jgi:fucose permease
MEDSGSASRPLRNDPIFWLVLALGCGYGAVFNFVPVTFPVFRRVFDSSLEQMGRTQVLFFASFLLFSIGGGWFIGRLGLRRAAAASVAIIAAGLAAIGSAQGFAGVLTGAFLLGLGIAATTVTGYSIINDYFGEKRQSVFFLFGVADAAGATAGPAALGSWIAHAEAGGGNWRAGYLAAVASVLALSAWVLLLNPARFPSNAGNRQNRNNLQVMREILSRPTIYVIGLAIFLHGVCQMGMVSWTGQLYQKKLNIDAALAAYFISANSAGFFAGRLLLSWVTARRHIPELLVLAACAAGGTLAFAGTIAADKYAAGLAMFAVAGFFISGDAPSTTSYAGTRFAGQSATAFSLMNGLGNIGGGAGPYLTGAIGSRFGLAAGIWMMPVFSLSLAALALGWYLRQTARRRVAVHAA